MLMNEPGYPPGEGQGSRCARKLLVARPDQQSVRHQDPSKMRLLHASAQPHKEETAIKHGSSAAAIFSIPANHAVRVCALQQVEQQLATIRHRKMPTLVTVGGDDRFISKKDNRQLLRKLGCDATGVCFYDANGNLISSDGCDEIVKVIELKDGSHTLANYPDVCNKALLELINRAQRR